MEQPHPVASASTQRKRVASIAAIALILVASIAVFIAMRAYGSAGESTLVARAVDSDGTEHVLPLDVDGEYVIETDLGTNTVAVVSGIVFVRSADCPNHDCIEQGDIDEVGEAIVCLPHQLIVTIEQEGDAA